MRSLARVSGEEVLARTSGRKETNSTDLVYVRVLSLIKRFNPLPLLASIFVPACLSP